MSLVWLFFVQNLLISFLVLYPNSFLSCGYNPRGTIILCQSISCSTFPEFLCPLFFVLYFNLLSVSCADIPMQWYSCIYKYTCLSSLFLFIMSGLFAKTSLFVPLNSVVLLYRHLHTSPQLCVSNSFLLFQFLTSCIFSNTQGYKIYIFCCYCYFNHVVNRLLWVLLPRV